MSVSIIAITPPSEARHAWKFKLTFAAEDALAPVTSMKLVIEFFCNDEKAGILYVFSRIYGLVDGEYGPNVKNLINV